MEDQMKNFFYRILCGFCLGISVFAPGISGSVMAIILGIYDKLLEIVANPFHNLKKNIKYLFPMGIGAVISFVLFILVFSYLFETYQTATYILFIGLIAGNLPVVFKQTREVAFKPHFLVGLVLTAGFACMMGILGERTMTSVAVAGLPLWYLGIAGGVAGFASLIPGMSISMILIVMGTYESLLTAVKTLDLLTVAVVGCSFVLAMVVSSRFIRFVFAKFTGFANYMVIGFLIGSILGIAYGVFAAGYSGIWNVLVGVLMLCAGLGISLLFVYLGKKVESTAQE